MEMISIEIPHNSLTCSIFPLADELTLRKNKSSPLHVLENNVVR